MSGPAQKRAKPATTAKPARLHSIAAIMGGRAFRGYFEVSDGRYHFTYSLAQARIANGKLEITGGLRVAGAGSNLRNAPHELREVRATLVAAQGGIGTPPARQKLPADISTAYPDSPVIESTGSLSFVGVLYFKLAPLDGRVLGVAADMREVQMNVRLAPVNDAERGLQGAFSSIVDALYGQQLDATAAEAATGELNKLFAER